MSFLDSYPLAEKIVEKMEDVSMFILEIPQVREAERKGYVFGFVSLTEEDFAAMKKVFALHSPFYVEAMFTKGLYTAFVESFRFVRKRNIQNNAVRYVCFVEIRIPKGYHAKPFAFEGHFKLHEKDDYLT